MVVATVCSPEFMDFLTSTIFPLAAYAGIITAIIIAVSFMVGQAIRNPKVTVWAKTEVVQLFISFVSLLLLSSLFGFFCSIDMHNIADIFEITYSGPSSMFDAAEDYLVSAARYSHNALTVVRYHLEGYTVLGCMGAFKCAYSMDHTGWGCWFGFSGTQTQPFGGYAALNAALNTIFNSTLMSYLMSLNYLMILLYIYKGFAFFLFPIGIFMRSMPYMRSFGSVLISIAISFSIIYPLFLATFNLMGDSIFNKPDYLPDPSLSNFLDEDTYPEHVAGVGATLGSATYGADFVKDVYYFPNGEKPAEAIAFGGMAFVVGFFLPSLAMLAAVASVVYLARLYGEEVDLSRIMQMV